MGLIDCLGVAVGLVALMTLIGLYLGFLSVWLSRKSSWTSRIKFEQWLDLYYLNPKDWYLEDTPNRYIYGANKAYGSGYWAYIHFSFVDYLRYRLWKRGTKRRENNAKRDKRLKDVLEVAQSDIERLKQQADREMEEAKNQIEKTSRRVNNPLNSFTHPPTREFWEATLATNPYLGRLPTSEEVSSTTDPWQTRGLNKHEHITKSK